MTKAYESTWDSLAQHATPKWFKDAKFGIYTHWGPYSVAAHGSNGSWYPSRMYVPGNSEGIYHTKNFGDPKEFG
jgi:alpha-L-fucosidase